MTSSGDGLDKEIEKFKAAVEEHRALHERLLAQIEMLPEPQRTRALIAMERGRQEASMQGLSDSGTMSELVSPEEMRRAVEHAKALKEQQQEKEGDE